MKYVIIALLVAFSVALPVEKPAQAQEQLHPCTDPSKPEQNPCIQCHASVNRIQPDLEMLGKKAKRSQVLELFKGLCDEMKRFNTINQFCGRVNDTFASQVATWLRTQNGLIVTRKVCHVTKICKRDGFDYEPEDN